jgi:S-formylglutathione hydrolase FrmB
MWLRLVSALCLSSVAIGSSAVATGSAACALPIAHGRVEVLHVPSEDNDVPVRDVWVYRPPVPDSAQLPVVYFLHGVPGAARDFFGAGGAAALDLAFAEGARPFVLAAPTGSGNARGDTEWANSVDGVDEVEAYVIDRVIPAVEGAHRRDRAHRIIAGFSMGGYGAANLALHHPNLFAGAASFAGYFHIDDPDAVFGNDPHVEDANDPEVLVKTVRSVRFWLGDGDSDDEPVVQGEAQRFAAVAGPLVHPGDLVLAPGSHNYGFVLDHVPDLARFVASVAASDPAAQPRASQRCAGSSCIASWRCAPTNAHR